MTRSFTAVAIGQLAQQGRVAFHEPLGTYLDGFPAEVAQATVHQLLTHTSGVGRPALTNERPPDQFDWDSVDEVWNGTLAFLRTRPLRFTPGSQFAYSNDGYFVLGAIVAAVTGLSYYDYVRRHNTTGRRVDQADHNRHIHLALRVKALHHQGCSP